MALDSRVQGPNNNITDRPQFMSCRHPAPGYARETQVYRLDYVEAGGQ